MTVEFVDELPAVEPHPTSIDYDQFAAELRANPGRWAKWPGFAHSGTASQIRNGMGLRAFRGGEFDAELRNRVVYIRYIGRADQ